MYDLSDDTVIVYTDICLKVCPEDVFPEKRSYVMATANEFEKSALVIGILSSAEERRQELLDILEENFGEILEVSQTYDFPYTDYYDEEMSGHPVRYLIMFRNLINPALLADIKIKTNGIEKTFANEKGRRINIDPGILTLHNFILATCKNRSHRIPLQNGVYGEVTLIYQDKDFQRLPWTYADYSCDEIKQSLREFRTEYKEIVRANLSKCV